MSKVSPCLIWKAKVISVISELPCVRGVTSAWASVYAEVSIWDGLPVPVIVKPTQVS